MTIVDIAMISGFRANSSDASTCSGKVVGDFQSQPMHVGDVAVIPAGIPHGWTDITDQVTYLSVRPDPKKVLKHGFVNPAIK